MPKPKPPSPGGAAARPTTAHYMVVLTPFQLWLQAQCVRHAWSQNALGRRLGVAVTTVHGWWWGRMQPAPIHEERLAELTGEKLDTLRDLVWESRRLRAVQRTTLREAGFASAGKRAGRPIRPVSASRRKPLSTASMYKPTSTRSLSKQGPAIARTSRDVSLAGEQCAQVTGEVNMKTFPLTGIHRLVYVQTDSEPISLPRRTHNCIAAEPEVRPHEAA
jgi:hypothetical protein